MKPVPFDYRRPRSLAAALDLLDSAPGAKILAGGQTLGPMLNLRLVRPKLLVDITRVPELVSVEETDDAVVIGGSVTHAAIEDGLIADPTNGFMRKVASDIAYRAVRTRGTIGGSLAHADPAADWLTTLVALNADVLIEGPDGRRRVPLSQFVNGVFETALEENEILLALHIPRLTDTARCGFYKYCRKAGEFAEAMAAAVIDEKESGFRLVAGATEGAPIVIDDPDGIVADGFDVERAMAALQSQGYKGDDYELRIHAVAMKRAWQEACAA